MPEAGDERFDIRALGRAGDGIADADGGAVFVPFTLPGETVIARREGTRAALVDVEMPSPERVAPICRHFGRCGGCALQMMPLVASRRFKRDLVIDALAKAGVAAQVEETIGTAVAARRRMVLGVRREGADIRLGLMERLSDALIDLRECPVAVPAIADRLSALRDLVAPLLAGGAARLTVLATRTGLDLDLDGGAASGGRVPARLPDLMAAAGAVRLSLRGAPLLTIAEPVLDVSGVDLVPPPGAFAQANAEAERAMTALVAEHFSGSKRAADLFSGFGPFALALAPAMRVVAVEADAASLAALADAAARARGLKPVETLRRDLFRGPLGPDELTGFDAVCFDPPEKGAEATARALARSGVGRVAAVSCNPVTFARDAGLLVAGGYRLERVVPVDQFTFSAATEVVGLFRRDMVPRGPRRRLGHAPSPRP